MLELGIGVGVVIILWLFFQSKGGQLSVDDAKALVKNGAVLIDVRSPAEFKQGHIDGAKNIPLNEIGDRASEVGKKDAQVVLYCRSGARSSGAQRILKRSGFEHVHNLGAMSKWN